MKPLAKALDQYSGRNYIYLSIFTIGSAICELIFQMTHPAPRSNATYGLAAAVIIVFTLVGLLFASQKHAESRIASGATLFILSIITLTLIHSATPAPYLLLAALGVTALGAHPKLHQHRSKTVLHGLLTIIGAIALSALFVYATYLYAVNV